MENKFGTSITDSVERVLRYIIPGVAFFLIFYLSYPCYFNKAISKFSGSGLAVFLVILTVGMSIYVVYSLIIRFTLERIVFKIGKSPVNLFSNDKCLCNYSKSHAKLILSRTKSQDYPKGYYTYLWSITHYSLILSVLLIIFAIKNDEGSWFDSNSIVIGIIGVGILILSLGSYYYMQVLEKDTTAILNTNEATSKKGENQTT